jgi:nucleolar protein 56
VAPDTPGEIVTTWFGAFLVNGQRIEKAYAFPRETNALAERMEWRRSGNLAPEEARLLSELPPGQWRSHDRRLTGPRVQFGGTSDITPDPKEFGHDPKILAELLLNESQRGLETAYDPSSHVEEAVRALRDLDGVLNTLRERLASWRSRDAPLPDPDDTAAFDLALEEAGGVSDGRAIARAPPELLKARQDLADQYVALRRWRLRLEKAAENAVASFAPNLTALLGASLAGRLISQAAGLDRLARLPSSTVQVLGAERAFFEHLRGRAPPPRHGVLFLHPDIQGAPRRLRGKLARALAGKASIAAKLDRAGSPLRPSLEAAFQARVRSIKTKPAARKGSAAPESRTPLD